MEFEFFFRSYRRTAVAFSGGVDSAYLLAEAVRSGADVIAYHVKTAFQPEFERTDALRTAASTGVQLREIGLNVLSDENVVSNPPDRCYHCKKLVMGAIARAAEADGCEVICDGTNASDDITDRPGFRALAELGVRSPLRECGITKDEIRSGARDLGLDVWNKPAYACLATRIAAGERITAEKLRITEEAESRLFGMGFRDFRVRMRGKDALVQIAAAQHEDAVRRCDEIEKVLGDLYGNVTTDPEPR